MNIPSHQPPTLSRKKPDPLKHTAIGIGAGLAAKTGTEVLCGLSASPVLHNTVLKKNAIDPALGMKLAEDMLKHHNLDKSLVSITTMTPESIREAFKELYPSTFPVRNAFGKLVDKSPLPKLAKKLLTLHREKMKLMFQTPHYNFLSREAKALKAHRITLPHELGHAVICKNLAATIGLVTHSAMMPKMQFALLGLALLAPNKQNTPEEGSNKIDKAAQFIKNNVGKLMFATWIPTLINEAGASTIAIDFLSKHKEVTPKLLKTFKSNYAIAFGSYLLAAGATALGANAAVKVKDAVMERLQKKSTQPVQSA